MATPAADPHGNHTPDPERRAAVLYADLGGAPTLDNVDVLAQTRLFTRVLRGAGWRVTDVPLSLNLEEAARRLRDLRPSLAVNLVECVDGRDAMQYLGPALLDHVGIPYTGSPTHAVLLSADKLLGKRTLEAAAIPTPGWALLSDVPTQGPPGPPPWIVKPVSEHASRGIDDDSVVRDAGTLDARARKADAPAWMVERYVEGRELSVSLLQGPLGVQTLPAAEIDFHGYPAGKPRIVGYAAKWEEHTFEYRATVRRFDFPHGDAPLLATVADLAQRCWRIFGLRGYARVDYRVDGEGRPWVLEVNANPCLSPDGGFAAAAAQAGIGLEDMVLRIVQGAGGNP